MSWLCLAVQALAQTAAPAPTSQASSAAERAIELAAKHRCDDALPQLSEAATLATDPPLKYKLLMATTRCAMQKKDGRLTVTTLLTLRHGYPKDPEVLYLTSQVFLT